MPPADWILIGLREIANTWKAVSIFWHAFLGAIVIVLALPILGSDWDYPMSNADAGNWDCTGSGLSDYLPMSALSQRLWLLLILGMVLWMWKSPQTFSFRYVKNKGVKNV